MQAEECNDEVPLCRIMQVLKAFLLRATPRKLRVTPWLKK